MVGSEDIHGVDVGVGVGQHVAELGIALALALGVALRPPLIVDVADRHYLGRGGASQPILLRSAMRPPPTMPTRTRSRSRDRS
jgi:hypothetical protein